MGDLLNIEMLMFASQDTIITHPPYSLNPFLLTLISHYYFKSNILVWVNP